MSSDPTGTAPVHAMTSTVSGFAPGTVVTAAMGVAAAAAVAFASMPLWAKAIVVAVVVLAGAAFLGLGIPPSWATDRRIVRAGWTLHLRLRNREEIWLSTRSPLDVGAVLGIADHPDDLERKDPS